MAAKRRIHVESGDGGGGGGGDGPDNMVMTTDAVVKKGTDVTVTLAGKYGTVWLWLSIGKAPDVDDDPVLKVVSGEKAIVWKAPESGTMNLAVRCDRDSPAHLVGAKATLLFD